ncbi:MAG: sterol desaturase family protein [Rhizobiales bacterium]|nr:sterol desaturase family protein [Hyphomicrobiales bacterium]
MEPGIENESLIRLSVFAGVFALMAVLELSMPRKDRTEPLLRRWFTNIGIVVVDTLTLRLLFPILAVGMAGIATAKGWGLFAFVDLPFWLEVAISAVLLDLAIYGQHVASHKVPMLWLVHRMHHADRDIDVTTGARFHPVEIVLSMLYKFAVIILLGAPALAVFIFEVLLNGSAMFNHANWRMPLWLDKIVRTVFVTPDMHRVHHSIHERETDSNYGFNLSIWDRMFGTYIDQPQDGHEAMTIGLKPYQDSKPSNILWCLLLPFKGKKP